VGAAVVHPNAAPLVDTDMVVCDHCLDSLFGIAAYDKHLLFKKHIRAVADGMGPLYCAPCGRQTLERRYLKKHRKTALHETAFAV